MTGNEMIAAVERKLPIVFIISHNRCYASIRINQEREYPGRHRGTTLFNPDFKALAEAFGVKSVRLSNPDEVEDVIKQAMDCTEPMFIEVMTSLSSVLPKNGNSFFEKDAA